MAIAKNPYLTTHNEIPAGKKYIKNGFSEDPEPLGGVWVGSEGFTEVRTGLAQQALHSWSSAP